MTPLSASELAAWDTFAAAALTMRMVASVPEASAIADAMLAERRKRAGKMGGCYACKGIGTVPESEKPLPGVTTIHWCPECDGKGRTRDGDVNVWTWNDCPACKGTGRVAAG